MQTSLAAASQTSAKQHAEFCERQFAADLIRRIRQWKWLGKPEKR